MANALNWFQIPVRDFDRAKKFYETLFGVEMAVAEVPGGRIGMFPADWQHGEVGGAISSGEQAAPSTQGTTVFLNANPDLQAVIDRVAGAGGQVVMPKMAVPMQESGYMAMIIDTEGNQVGLHGNG